MDEFTHEQSIYFIDQPGYYDRSELYQEHGEDYKDTCERFVFFSRAVMEQLRESGMLAVRGRWAQGAEIIDYLRDPEALPPPHRPGGPRHANVAFLLGLTNWALAANVKLGPWLHLQTDSQFYGPVPWGTEITSARCPFSANLAFSR